MEVLRRRLLYPKEAAYHVVQTSLSVATAPIHLWIKAWLLVVHLATAMIRTPKRILKKVVSSVSGLMGR